jgi:hypothetical protein
MTNIQIMGDSIETGSYYASASRAITPTEMAIIDSVSVVGDNAIQAITAAEKLANILKVEATLSAGGMRLIRSYRMSKDITKLYRMAAKERKRERASRKGGV